MLDRHQWKTSLPLSALKKSSLPVLACVAAFGVMLVVGGILVHNALNSPTPSEEEQLIAAELAQDTQPAPLSKPVTTAAATVDPVLKELEDPFARQVKNRQRRKDVSKRLGELLGDDRPFSATALASNQENTTDQLFARQELIMHKGAKEDTVNALAKTQIMMAELDNEVEQVEALLNQAKIYKLLDFDKEATASYDDARAIVSIMGDVNQQALSEAAFASYHIRQGHPVMAKSRFKVAKSLAERVDEPEMKDLTFGLIALSEANSGLMEAAELTAEHIDTDEMLANALKQVSSIAAQGLKSDDPIFAAMTSGTGDKLFDDLVSMQKNNKKIFQTVSSLADR